MRLAFMGTPDFAVPSLDALLAAGHEVAAVYCQPPRPAGRGGKLTPSAVQRRAEALGLPVRCPVRWRSEAGVQAAFADLSLDLAVVAAYGLILPDTALRAPRDGCLNVHASLLPRWRGASPIAHAILAGDRETGVTIMRMTEGLDSGPTLLAGAVPIAADATTASLTTRLAELGADLIVRALAETRLPVPQPLDGVTLAPKLSRADGVINWELPASEIDRRIRAFDPWPGSVTTLTLPDGAEERLAILAARVVDRQGEPGTVLDAAFTVACGQGALSVTRARRPGRPVSSGADLLRGLRLTPPFALRT